MIIGYIVISGVSLLAISGVVGEKHLAEQDKLGAARTVSLIVNRVFPLGCIGAAVYSVWNAIQLFL